MDFGKGLTTAEVRQRVEQGNVNKFKDRSRKSVLAVILSHMIDLPNTIIFVSVIFLVIYNQLDDAVLISGVILTNMLVSIFQELRARASLQKINVVNTQPVTVIRDGKEQQVHPEELVLDDTIKVSGGEYLFVDGELIVGRGLLFDESILTGESDYQKKQAGAEVYSGSFAVNGHGYYRATKVGEHSFINKITAQARKYVNITSPLQRDINNLVKLLTIITVFVIALLLSLNIFILDMTQTELLESVVSIVSSMVPQGIVITLTLAFTLGVIRMYRQGILVQKASAVETLAGVKVLCMDKTGTITENKLQVVHSEFFGRFPHQELVASFLKLISEKNKTALAIESQFGGVLKSEPKLLSEVPFNSQSKYSAVALEFAGKTYELVLGSLDILGKLLPEAAQAKLQKLDKEQADQGLRNLLFLVREAGAEKYRAETDWVAHRQADFEPLAFISIEDKLRHGARRIIESFRGQGIKPVIISGDGAATLQAIAKKLQIPDMDIVVTGQQLAEITSPAELTERIVGADIFARVTPEQKLMIVDTFQRTIGRVAMIGDGVNDALAIKQADLGISLADGANVTKNISDVILLDNDLRKLSAVMREGKEILFDMLRSGQLLIIKNIYALILILAALILTLPFPFTFRGLFILALLNTNLPIVLIFIDKDGKVRNFNFMFELLTFSVIGGAIAGIMGIAILLGLRSSMSFAEVQMVLLSFLLATGVVNSLYALNKSFSLPKLLFGSWYSLVAVVDIIIYLALVYFAPTRDLFELTVLTVEQWLLVIALGVSYLLLFALLMPRLREIAPVKAFVKSLAGDEDY
jgi:cation-transporting ATPase E